MWLPSEAAVATIIHVVDVGPKVDQDLRALEECLGAEGLQGNASYVERIVRTARVEALWSVQYPTGSPSGNFQSGSAPSSRSTRSISASNIRAPAVKMAGITGSKSSNRGRCQLISRRRRLRTPDLRKSFFSAPCRRRSRTDGLCCRRMACWIGEMPTDI